MKLATMGLLAFSTVTMSMLAETNAGQVKVTILADKSEVGEGVALPVDPTLRVRYGMNETMMPGLATPAGEPLTISPQGGHQIFVMIDNQQSIFGQGNGKWATRMAPLKDKGGRPRTGVSSEWVTPNNIHITQIVEIIPSKAPPKNAADRKRHLDVMLVRYVVENKDTVNHTVGIRNTIDIFLINNDGALFASPTTHKGQIINGHEFKGDKLPEYLQVLQQPNVDNPGYVTHFTLKVGKLEPPTRFVCTNLGACFQGNNWDVQALPAGDSAVAIFFDPKAIPAGGKRDMAWAYGISIASNPENEGRVNLQMAGAFEPGKQFTITAYVDDPLETQSLTLELPMGLRHSEGKPAQTVPAPSERGQSIVVWKVRVDKLGAFPIKVVSSNGVTYNTLLMIEDLPNGEIRKQTIGALDRRQIHFGKNFALVSFPSGMEQAAVAKPAKVTIDEEKTESSDRMLPLDPAIRATYDYIGMMSFGINSDGKRLTCGPGSAMSSFKIDGQVFYPEDNLMFNKNGQQVMPAPPKPLPPGPYNKKRTGIEAEWSRGEIKITMILEVVPGRPHEKNTAAPQKRRMDTVLVKYIIENNDTKAHSVGARMFIDTMCGNNDGAIFASPTTHPNMLLDGVILKDKEVPEFIEMLEIPDLKNPGFKGVFTLKMGNKIEGPNKIVLTSTGAGGDWDVPALKAGGDSAVAIIWDPKEIKAKSKREVAFALGQSIACNPESEGKVSMHLGGSFEPHKSFTVTAYVDDPIEGQSLELELPKGMERIEGKAVQTVPQPNSQGQSVVMWRCRVLEMGMFPIRIQSSNGMTQTRVVTVSQGQ